MVTLQSLLIMNAKTFKKWDIQKVSVIPEHACVLSCFSCVWMCATPWTATCQAPLTMGFSRQEYWSGVPCPPPGDFPNLGIEPMSPMSPALAGGFFTTSTTWEACHSWDHSLIIWGNRIVTLQTCGIYHFNWIITPQHLVWHHTPLMWCMKDTILTYYAFQKTFNLRTWLVVQWLRILLPMQGTQVWSLVQEDSTSHGATKPESQNDWACAPGACARQQEDPPQWEVRAPQQRVAPVCCN